ncbi:class I SAM-dependent methyltransferase [Brevundimonas sp. 2R-24]|uniref:Class I SAM-dependent methyltransferase n=1 Tax=Peiella sedimenti TaxID=3061083 RepID=A0ABT8SMU1_9CAUL|nr:class I SAM-dependent methyltransferase [Caulobacteraceae bacterium XZ-24]
MLMRSSSRVDAVRAGLIADHQDTPYYDQAEDPVWVGIFWSEPSIFLDGFRQLDLSSVMELACGRGRHAEQFADRAGKVVLIDPLKANVEACRRRHARRRNVSVRRNNGRDLSGCRDGEFTAVFSYDAMVHFEATDTIRYLGEIARVLRPGGRALLHYSTDDSRPVGSYRDHPRWRSFFSEPMMLHFAGRAGLHALSSVRTSWPPNNGEPPVDGCILLEKTQPMQLKS